MSTNEQPSEGTEATNATNLTPVNTSETELTELTDKNILFLHYLKEGMSTIDAYAKAGYVGNSHSAYTLRTRLKNDFAVMLAGDGLGTREGILLKLKRLQDLPIASPVLSIKEAIELLKLEAKLQPKEEKTEKLNVTPIIINIASSAIVAKTVEAESKVIDIESVEDEY